MTLTEMAQFLGNLGEFLSSIAVLATLVYLTVQIRQTKEQLVHTSQVTRGEAALQLMSSISESPHIAPILAKLGAGPGVTTVWTTTRIRFDLVPGVMRGGGSRK